MFQYSEKMIRKAETKWMFYTLKSNHSWRAINLVWHDFELDEYLCLNLDIRNENDTKFCCGLRAAFIVTAEEDGRRREEQG